jgi:hypothetical protein
MRRAGAALAALALAACAGPAYEDVRAATGAESRAYMDCAMDRGAALALRVDEPANVVAIAALAACADEEIALLDALEGAGYRADRARAVVERAEAIAFRQVVGLVVRLRAADAREQPPAPALVT